jgi:hypothetical protein
VNIVEFIAACVCPVRHILGETLPINIPKLPWELAREFGHHDLEVLLKNPSPIGMPKEAVVFDKRPQHEAIVGMVHISPK